MKHAKLGTPDVGRIGLGTMGMSHAYTGAGIDEGESIRTIRRRHRPDRECAFAPAVPAPRPRDRHRRDRARRGG